MALVNSLTYSLRDYAGKRDTVRLFFPSTTLEPAIQSLSDAFAAELDAITDAVIEGCTLAKQVTLPGTLKATAVNGSDINRGINWNFDVEDSVYSYTIRTHAPPDAIVDGENLVPSADTNDFLTVMIDGDGTTDPTDNYDNDILAANSQKVTFHK